GGIQGVDESIRNANPDKAYAWRGWDPVLGTHPNNSEQFVIKVTAGDLNGDGYVDWDDLTHVGNSIGSTNADNGDFDGNGTVEQADMDDFVTRLFETFYGDAALSGDWDVNDIDYVTKKAFASTYSAIADMDFDRDTDETDVDLWLAAAAAANGFGSAYYRGDANLDGTVDGQDFSLLKANFGSSDAAWIDGDFNGDGNVDGQDFSLLKANFGAASAEQIAALETFEASIVPEPASLLLLGLGGILLTRRRTMS
ncbi:MAG: dockerin type I domain-containing protein, partial [Rhodospirillales bacterium]|nr:dockerin type I domain-containing protein [Rhodospirillales bacterium]